MKKVNIYIAALVGFLSIISCTQREEVDFQEIKVDKIFSAYMADDSITKTVIDGEIGDEYRKTLWLPGDSVGIASGYGKPVEKFVNTNTSASELALLEGSISSSGENYYAIYPYHSSLKMELGFFTFDIPANQKYQKNSFAPDAAPMVARLETDSANQSFYFKNLCGVLIINLTGEEKVKSITFTGKDEAGENMKVSGKWSVDMTYTDTPIITPTDSSSTSVTLQCQEGEQLDPVIPTPFYIVLPPATYHTFSVMVTTTDGKFMFKEATKPLTIKRANVTSAASLIYTESIGIDLSERGTSNSYIVSKPGVYSFDVSVIGNGISGIIPDAGFHTDDPSIVPISADIYWSDRVSLISSLSLDKESKKVTFLSNGEEGNALVAIRDAEGKILWSWHIWCTDKPQEQEYINNEGTFYVLDRNLGAIRNNSGSTEQELKESMGTLYFWGRKDPFGVDTGNSAGETLTILQVIENPHVRHSTGSWSHGGDSWMKHHMHKAWSTEQKTIYDPCPVGYIVASSQIWSGFTSTGAITEDIEDVNKKDSYNQGWNFYLDDTMTATSWYPLSHAYTWGGRYTEINRDYNSVWSADYSSNTTKNALALVYKNEYDVQVGVWGMHDGWALPVRCMKDDGFIDAALPVVAVKEIKEISATTATLVGEVVSAGNGEVTDRGFILGSTPGISLENGTVYKCESGIGEYSLPLEELTSLTKYYVKAYAVNEYGTSYSQVKSFMTDYEGEAINLSVDGTANSYLVRDQGRDFIFDASVKGNSTELVGTPASAEVLWETKNTDESVSKGDIISSVSLMDGGFVQFSIPTEYTPGNALIAVKDADGVILWSWHIWVADFDPVTTQQTYQSGAVMMDRNMGSLNVQENDPRANGLFYLWGRKDPMCGAISSNSFAQTYPANIFTRDVTNSITEAIQNPTHFGNTPWSTDNTLWASAKTKYDPCPVGWRVPDGGPDGVWSGFGTYSQDVTNGAYFDAPYSTPRAFYPRGGYAQCGDMNIYFYGGISCHWSCAPVNNKEAYTFALWNGQGESQPRKEKQSLFNVRCQKDESQSAVSIPAVQIKEVKDVTQDGVTVVSEVVRDGRSSVIEKGILVGETSDLTIDNALKVVKSESTEKEFTLTVNDLLDGTKYYVRSYAKNSAGIGYSEARSFTTVYSGNVRDLSANGTANSYIVNKYGIYSFNATVKGNSTTPLEAIPVSAEVLWETRNTSESITIGCVVKDVTFEDGRVKFATSDDVTPGNALIAVKDADGYILWSWHIWVVDYNPEVQYHTYPSGAVMMDRNLGALNNGNDYLSGGLLYQWGRKDPFMGNGGNSAPSVTAPANAIKYEKTSAVKGILAYVQTNPNVILYNEENWDWLYVRDHTLWGDKKTMYDPCPPGWQVPSAKNHIWDGLNGVYYPDNYYRIDGINSDFGRDYWTTTYIANREDCVHSKGGQRGKLSPTNVRCVRITGVSIDDIDVKSEVRTASVGFSAASSLAKSILKAGVVFSQDANQTLVITNSNASVYEKSDSDMVFGNLTLDIENLTPNVKYYYRVYVITELGISYSDVGEFTTKASGNNEGVGDDDYEW